MILLLNPCLVSSSSYGTIFHATSASQRYRNAIFTTLPMLAGRQSAAAITDKVKISEKSTYSLNGVRMVVVI